MSGADPSWAAVRALFEELVEAEPPERARRLASITDSDLRRSVERLLEAEARAGGFLETPAAQIAGELLDDVSAPADEALLPERLGAWRVLGRLGRGGMGEVLLGERADGLFEQRVAIKLLRRGMDSEDVLRRFERERRILARLEHPHIARLSDGGAAPDGRPYFVMELVEGKPITVHCRERGLATEDRLRLLLDCCDAVSAAHARLVVHRDLKPSNVLVTDAGQVKLLDFGIAKVLAAEEEGGAGAETGATHGEMRLLTPAYAAPEQVLGEPVTTATDVWALGALGYELLTGTLPVRRDAREAAGLAKSVERETLERPSARVARTEPEKLPLPEPTPRERKRLERRLSGDLDNILATALRREPERRYASVAAFAADIRRHLSGRPVSARADSVGYRASKFLRRHRLAVSAAALVLVSLLAGLGATVWQARRAEANARAAQKAARRAGRVKEFLIGLFEVADPEKSSGGSITAKDLIDQAGRRLETELANEPEVQADLLEAVARIDRGLGLLDPAEKLARRSLAIRERVLPTGDAAIGSSLATLGAVETGRGKLDVAERLLARAVAILEAKDGPDSLATARARSDYGQVLFWKGDGVRSEALERRVYETFRRELGDDNVQTAIHLGNLGVLLDEIDRLPEAEAAYRKSMAVLEKRLGPEHPTLGENYLNLAELLERLGRADEAEALYKKSYDVRRRALGASHPALGQTLQLTGLFYLNQGRLDESEKAYLQALAIFRAIDPKHFEVGKIENGLALGASRRGRYAEAEERLARVEALFREVLGEKHPFTWMAMGNRADQIARQGRLAEAEAMERTVAAKLVELNGADSGEALDAEAHLAETLRWLGRPAEALPLHQRALAKQTQLVGADNVLVALLEYQVAADLLAIGRPEDRAEARRLLDAALATLGKRSPPHWRMAEVVAASAKARELYQH